MLSGRALEDGATHPRRGWGRDGEQAKDIHRVGQLAAAGGADFQMPVTRRRLVSSSLPRTKSGSWATIVR